MKSRGLWTNCSRLAFGCRDPCFVEDCRRDKKRKGSGRIDVVFAEKRLEEPIIKDSVVGWLIFQVFAVYRLGID
jgi:hypothetical protein